MAARALSALWRTAAHDQLFWLAGRYCLRTPQTLIEDTMRIWGVLTAGGAESGRRLRSQFAIANRNDRADRGLGGLIGETSERSSATRDRRPIRWKIGKVVKSPAGRGLTPLPVGTWPQPFLCGRITLATRQELRMVVVTTAQYHRNRAEHFRSHAEHATLAETREMYLRLARTEDAMAEQAERRHQSERVAPGQLTLPVPQDPKKPNGES
jgi:hypothetical protein